MRHGIPKLVRWANVHRRQLNAWFVRAVSFYFGFKILQHEIYHKDHVEPLLIFLGLWLCGVAPATLFDSLRKGRDELSRGGTLEDPDVTRGKPSNGQLKSTEREESNGTPNG